MGGGSIGGCGNLLVGLHDVPYNSLYNTVEKQIRLII